MKNFCYFVSYSYPNGFGMTKASCSRKIKSYNDILELRDTISNSIGLDDIVILNYQLLRKNS